MTRSTYVESPPAASFDIEAQIRPAIRSIPSYKPAKLPTDRPARTIKLDMNESPYGPSPKAQAALAGFNQTHRYPDFAQIELCEALSRYIGASAEQIVAGAGLDDVLNNLGLLLIDPGDEVIISEPTFGVYRSLMSLHGGVIVDVPLDPSPDFSLNVDAIIGAITDRTKLVIVCNPNNPTGTCFDPAAVEQIIAGTACMVAVDEAYAEFSGLSHLPLMTHYPNLAILRTMSKFAGIAGMRVGYGVFPEAVMPHLRRVAPPFFNISAASAAVAIASLDDLNHLNGVVARIVADRDALAASLRELPGVEPFPSATNFLLVRLPVPDAAPVVAELAARGVHVRHFARPELGIRDCLRVSIGTTKENEIFLHELTTALETQGLSQ